ncbi:cytochrome [Mycolicibacterium moriokaense]|uniref:Cytochrome P450 n=1 Tax=Mycolicibacterium moriokaense TaxID=39691 RepID=A0AAD1M9R1_9MYCO|nr:cytochrome P450 [Mycolicibacterium moriokaense]MCV7042121.1 cytochrome P450 [Mycolicibacterium moriokaense]ORB25187.1 cytochrome [Mycolicibacterium moriokaense]BBX04891.1 cytochrome P450 [Mycolicibacterium moriokaense]
MTSPTLDRQRIRELFDLRSSFNEYIGGRYHDDPYPIWHRLREQGPVLPGILHELTGVPGTLYWHGLPNPDRPHFTTFDFETGFAAYRNPEVLASSPEPIDLDNGPLGVMNSMLSMDGDQHKRYRALVQPSFLPSNGTWWTTNWVSDIVDLLIDGFARDGRAELNVDFCAAIPLLTITGSFGVPMAQALEIRSALARDPQKVVDIVRPIVEARRKNPADDLISTLVQAEITDDDGVNHRLTDREIDSFVLLLLGAGSGTTWKQMGITLTALLQRPDVLEAVREDRSLLRPAIEESVRWMPTDPMFSRHALVDTELGGVEIPAGSVVHIGIGPANRDPARWDRPDEFDITRKMKPSLGFGQGSHICLGMHVARAEMTTAISALLDRLPNLRLDPDQEAPRIIGLYERGATAIPVLFDAG